MGMTMHVTDGLCLLSLGRKWLGVGGISSIVRFSGEMVLVFCMFARVSL